AGTVAASWVSAEVAASCRAPSGRVSAVALSCGFPFTAIGLLSVSPRARGGPRFANPEYVRERIALVSLAALAACGSAENTQSPVNSPSPDAAVPDLAAGVAGGDGSATV